jgi:hypothetical protein
MRRVREEMAQRSIDACVLVDPVSIRYACGARNMQVFHLRNPARSLVVPVEGPVVLFEFTGCMHLAEGLETVDEIRPSVTASYVAAGDGIGDAERAWARQVGDEIRRHCGRAPVVGVERVNAGALNPSSTAAINPSGCHAGLRGMTGLRGTGRPGTAHAEWRDRTIASWAAGTGESGGCPVSTRDTSCAAKSRTVRIASSE